MTSCGPQRMIRLSLLAPEDAIDPFGIARIRVKRLREQLKEQGIQPGEWSWTLEKNPKDTGYHAHVVQRGSFVPQDELQWACQRVGVGIPYINAIKGSASRTARYGLKGYGASGYGLKTYAARDDVRFALALNGGRLEHHSPAFFHIDGEKARVREVESHAVETLTDYGSRSRIVTSPQRARELLYLSSDKTLQEIAENSRLTMLGVGARDVDR